MLTDVLLVLGLVWLLGLTVLFAGVVRHLGAMQAAVTTASTPQSELLVDTDGPWIPSAVPDRTRAALIAGGVLARDLTVTFFSSSCSICFDRATQIAKAVREPDRHVFLVTGSHPESLTKMRGILEPAGAPILGDPYAHDAVKALEINSTPFAVRIVDDQVVGKAYVRGLDDYLRVAAPTPTPYPSANGATSNLTKTS
jgi:hypothetical protein